MIDVAAVSEPGSPLPAWAEEITTVARGLVITDTDVQWFGDRWSRRPPPAGDDAEAALVVIITQLLYSHFYSVSRPMLRRELDGLVSSTVPRGLGPALAVANPGHGRREAGWQCMRVVGPERSVVVRKHGLQLLAPAELVRPANLSRLDPGTPVIVDTPAGSMNRSAGYYVAHSDADLDYQQPMARLYLNVSPDSGPGLLHDLCGSLNAAGRAFDLKMASDAAHFYRADVGVLYIPRPEVASVWDVVRPVLARGAHLLRSVVPALTCRITAGVGAADDPGSGTSFGLDRCRAMAVGLVRTAESLSVANRVAAVTAAFEESGIDPLSPYLSFGRDDPYGGLR